MDPADKKKCISHLHHCVEYKRIILLKVLDPIQLPLVLDKYIFTYIGFFPIVFEHKVPRPLRFSPLEEP